MLIVSLCANNLVCNHLRVDTDLMFRRLRGFFSNDLSIDLGTANTLIYVRGKGIILDEPSVVAIRKNGGTLNTKSIRAIGTAAKRMLGRTPGHIHAIRPLKDGVIADFTVTEKMLQYFINSVHGATLFKPSPRVLICVPCGSTQVRRRAIRDRPNGAGARSVYLIEEPMAAAIGAGMPVSDARGSMVLDIGGGTTEVAVISLNGIVYSDSVRIGGDRFDEAIISYIRRKYGSLIGDATAEEIKLEIGCAYPSKQVMEMEVRGRNLAEGIPRNLTLNSNEILEALQEPLSGVVDAVKKHWKKPSGTGRGRCRTRAGINRWRRFIKKSGPPVNGGNQFARYYCRGPVNLRCPRGGCYLEMIDQYGSDILVTE